MVSNFHRILILIQMIRLYRHERTPRYASLLKHSVTHWQLQTRCLLVAAASAQCRKNSKRAVMIEGLAHKTRSPRSNSCNTPRHRGKRCDTWPSDILEQIAYFIRKQVDWLIGVAGKGLGMIYIYGDKMMVVMSMIKHTRFKIATTATI